MHSLLFFGSIGELFKNMNKTIEFIFARIKSEFLNDKKP